MDLRKLSYNAMAGKRLQTARKNIGITQAEMAEELDSAVKIVDITDKTE